MTELNYLEEERQKIWSRIEDLESQLKNLMDFIATNIAKDEIELRKNIAEAKAAIARTNEIQKDIDSNLSISHKTQEIITTLLVSAQNDASEIDQYRSSSSTNTVEITNLLQQAYKTSKEIEARLDDLDQLHERRIEAEKNADEINDIQSTANELLSKIESTLKNSASRKNDLDTIYYRVFGYTQENEDSGETETIKGLKDELEDAFKQLKTDFKITEESINKFREITLESYKKDQNEMQTTLNQRLSQWNDDISSIKGRINELLPKALTAGLSHAYSEKKSEEKIDLETHKKSFDNAIRMMMAISAIPIAFSFYQVTTLHLDLRDAILQLPRLVLAIVPIYIPALWIAYTSSKKANLSKRLIEEYSHKEALSKTYEGLSTQIANLGENEATDELRVKLLYNILEVSSENPGKLITDYNKSDHPVLDALDRSVKLTDSLTKLARVPGFKKLAQSLSDGAERALNIQSEKAEAGIEAVKINKKAGAENAPQ